MQEVRRILDVHRGLTICYCDRSSSVVIVKTSLLFASFQDE